MSTPKGYPSQKKDDRLRSEFCTVQPIGEDRFGLDVVVSMYHQAISTGDLIDALITNDAGDVTGLTVNAHGAKKGDLVYFKDNNLANRQIKIWDVPDANTLTLSETILAADPLPAIGDEIDILAPIMPRTNSDGDLIVQPGNLKFQLDGSSQDVIEDTVTPANNVPLPVKLISTGGEVTINAGDLNVDLNHADDSVKIGDGTDLMAVNADGSINTTISATDLDIRDLAHTQDSVSLGDGTVLFTAGQKASASSIPVVLSSEQEAMIDGIEASLTSIAGEDFATQTTLALLEGKDFATQTTLAALLTELQAKADLAETQPVSAAALPLPTGAATEATLVTIDSVLDSLLTELQLKADLTETQPVSAAALPLPTGAATEATLATIDGVLDNLLTELQLKADLSETQPVSAASLPLPTGAATEATLAAVKTAVELIDNTVSGTELQVDLVDIGGAATEATLATIDGVLDNIKIDTGNIDTSLNNIEAATALLDTVETGSEIIDLNGVDDSSWVQLFATTTEEIKKAAIFMSSGRVLEFGLGIAASEVRKFVVAPGGYPGQPIEVNIPIGSRVTYRFVPGEGTGAAGEKAVINWMG